MPTLGEWQTNQMHDGYVFDHEGDVIIFHKLAVLAFALKQVGVFGDSTMSTYPQKLTYNPISFNLNSLFTNLSKMASVLGKCELKRVSEAPMRSNKMNASMRCRAVRDLTVS